MSIVDDIRVHQDFDEDGVYQFSVLEPGQVSLAQGLRDYHEASKKEFSTPQRAGGWFVPFNSRCALPEMQSVDRLHRGKTFRHPDGVSVEKSAMDEFLSSAPAWVQEFKSPGDKFSRTFGKPPRLGGPHLDIHEYPVPSRWGHGSGLPEVEDVLRFRYKGQEVSVTARHIADRLGIPEGQLMDALWRTGRTAFGETS